MYPASRWSVAPGHHGYQRAQPAAEVMGSDAGLHADQARCDVRHPGSDLAARPSLAHDDRATLIQADDVK
jgi:hypothetical protein